MRYADITDRLANLGGDKWALHNAARAAIAAGDPVIELTIGEPDITTDPALIRACIDALNAGRTRYSNGRGEANLIEALIDTYRPRMPEIAPGNILCFPGTQTALYAVMQALVQDGQGVLIGDPYYATYEGVVRATGAHVQPVPLRMEDGFVLQPDALAAAITPESRVLLLNTPHNPTGAIIPIEVLERIGDLAVAHDLWIVCDEVYEKLIFAGEFASPLQIARLRDRVVVVSSISKTFAATGFRSGWAIGPEEFCDRLLPISETMLFGNQPFIADMTEAALRGHVDTADRLRTAFARRAGIVQRAVSRVPGLRADMPRGGMFIMVDVGGTGLDGDAFAWRLMQEKSVAVMPGSSFGAEAANLVRIALTVPDEVMEDAMTRIADLCAALAVPA
ncbi:pyridoxal phosphate-dependent aminotransferase [Paracoccus zeaxanthinifaciens]|uniref:pyridoxal phosphate-dependent aminotransferase n=1 Tax=Paracoccus zeaxanthinifaciens TaxID=187400 RepID=UPI0003B4D53C|nr:pyridoxal phosphate-dependent aminotransferase [Paracoccus zeaxanthinifaciens]